MDNCAASSASPNLDSPSLMAVRKGISLPAYLNPQYILHITSVSHDLNGVWVFAPDNRAGNGKSYLVDGVRVVIRSRHNSSQVSLENINVSYRCWHKFVVRKSPNAKLRDAAQ